MAQRNQRVALSRAGRPDQGQILSDRCAYRYRRSSLSGSALGLNGAPAYKATATAFWTLRFELDGVARAVPGAPREVHRDATSAPVVVVEVQTIVTSVG